MRVHATETSEAFAESSICEQGRPNESVAHVGEVLRRIGRVIERIEDAGLDKPPRRRDIKPRKHRAEHHVSLRPPLRLDELSEPLPISTLVVVDEGDDVRIAGALKRSIPGIRLSTAGLDGVVERPPHPRELFDNSPRGCSPVVIHDDDLQLNVIEAVQRELVQTLKELPKAIGTAIRRYTDRSDTRGLHPRRMPSTGVAWRLSMMFAAGGSSFWAVFFHAQPQPCFTR